MCLVTSGRELDDEKCEYIAKLAKAINQEELGLHLIACCGRADLEQLEFLRDAGIHSYNHNLETSQNFFPKFHAHMGRKVYHMRKRFKGGVRLVQWGDFWA